MSSGFVISGAGEMTVILRAIGPSLRNRAVAGAISDPTIDVFDAANTLIASNDNWRDVGDSEFAAGGRYEALQPANELESAIALDLSPGAYTAVVRGKNETTGTALAELYDFSGRADAKLSSVSARGFLQTGEDILLVGLGVGGEGGTTLILRALGPSLTEVGVSNSLSDPKLELYDRNGTLVGGNNDWQDDPDQLLPIQESGLSPKSALESAIALTPLPSGDYMALVRGNNNATGVVLLEVYNLR